MDKISVKCTHLTKAGKPCSNFAVHGMEFCCVHASKEMRKEFRAKKLEPRALLEEQLRKVRRADAGPLEKARLILDIMKFLRELDDKPEPEKPKDETPQEYSRRLKGLK